MEHQSADISMGRAEYEVVVHGFIVHVATGAGGCFGLPKMEKVLH
jgi:hypothetical protein